MSQAPPPSDSLTLATTPNAVRWARLHTTDILSRWRVPATVIETVELIVSELTTNAVQHPEEGEQVSPYSSLSALRTFELVLQIGNGAVRVSVCDNDEQAPVLKQPGVDATSGRGILLVAAMSSKWGHYPVRNRDRAGKVVWAEVNLVPAAEPRRHERARSSPGQPSEAGRSALPRTSEVDPHLLGRVLVGVRGL
ncbi:ATP-binding protein [Streptomyces sp. NRRL F-4474]|uniref:ATP-binding protein n=1 Tax=Streptomyces sp. NRRL F-4474 TaxID=1463851 RepID=UPI0004CBE273|nr:ATP-binding protein [Streptomyces sp. NRRL F-4474]